MVIHRVMVLRADKANTRNENSLTSVLKNLLIVVVTALAQCPNGMDYSEDEDP